LQQIADFTNMGDEGNMGQGAMVVPQIYRCNFYNFPEEIENVQSSGVVNMR
jgi:hypothetical protein